MRYWVYINDKVVGPYDEDKLAELDGFTPDTLICSEDVVGSGSQEWLKASSIFEFEQAPVAPQPAPVAPTPVAPAPVAPAQPGTQSAASAQENETTNLLLQKIEALTQQLEGMQTKLNEALTAQEATQSQLASLQAAQQEKAASSLSEASQPAVTEEALTTTNLVRQAEKLVSPDMEGTSNTQLDLMDEIQIDKAKNSTGAGEEVVLRSALDSMYRVEQTQEEKETTFQDLLSPFKEAAAATAGAAAGAALAKAALDTPNKEAQTTADVQEKPAELQSLSTTDTPAISEEKRDEIIDQITAPEPEKDFISQAVEEARQAEEAKTAQEQPVAETSADKEPLDLSDQLGLTIAGTDEDISASPEPIEEKPAQQEEIQQPFSQDEPELQAMAPDTDDINAKEKTDTIKELVPGKKLESEHSEEDLITQEDLEKAFTERTPAGEDFFAGLNATKQDSMADLPSEKKSEEPEELAVGATQPEKEPKEIEVPIQKQAPAETDELQQKEEVAEQIEEQAAPETQEALEKTAEDSQEQETSAAEQEQDEQTAKDLATARDIYNPKEMTEVQLKEGSTYLISDFIPPAETGNKTIQLDTSDSIDETKGDQSTDTKKEDEEIEEIVTADSMKGADVQAETAAEVQTKRGATLDIKTVPMVQDPTDSDRLDLTDSELDINAQHDMKAADFEQPTGNLTKIILGALVSIVILAIIYVMLAYLEIVPAQFNFLKSSTTVEDVQQNEQLNEMLEPETVVVDAEQAVTAPEANPLDPVLNEVKNYQLPNGQTLQQLINTRHPAVQDLAEWTITTAVEPDNYSVLVKIPPTDPQSFKVSYRFNYNAATKALEPTISDSKNLLDSAR